MPRLPLQQLADRLAEGRTKGSAMFSVKHVNRIGDAKTENLYMGESVRYSDTPSPDFAPLEVRKGDVLVASLWGGTAYVMNETGKTIDVYHLRPQAAA